MYSRRILAPAMIKISLISLRNVISHRPPGYFDDIMRCGTVQGNTLTLQPDDYIQLCRKYGSTPFIYEHSTSQQIPSKQWPTWAKALKLIARPEDKGIGDVVARTIGAENSEAFKAFYHRVTGRLCNCKGRQERWNRLYPLNQQPTQTP